MYLQNFFKKIIIFFVFLVIFFISVYTSLIYKPDFFISIGNKISKDSYSFNYSEIQSDLKLITPKFLIKDLSVKNSLGDDLANISEITIGMNILASIFNGYITLHYLEIKDFIFFNNNLSKNDFELKIMLQKFKIFSKDLDIFLNESYINLHSGQISSIISSGTINRIPFENLKIFNNSDTSKYYFSTLFKLNEEIIKSENLSDISNFFNSSINLNIESKGFIDAFSNEVTSLNKYIFFDSKLKLENDYYFNNINSVLYTNLNDNLTGIFSSNMSDQSINGTINVLDANIFLKSQLKINMSELYEFNEFLAFEGYEKFDAKISIIDKKASLTLNSKLLNTTIISNINEISKEKGETLNTNIYVKNFSNPVYEIDNNKFSIKIDSKNNGFFSFGSNFDEEIEKITNKDGFYLFISLKKLNLDNININYPFKKQTFSNLKSFLINVEEFDFFSTKIKNQKFTGFFNEKASKISFFGSQLNGSLIMDDSGFTRINLEDSILQINIDNDSNNDNFLDQNLINLRFIGKNLTINDKLFKKLNFYFLKNDKITTIDDLEILSDFINVTAFKDAEKSYISYNKQLDLYKVKGSFIFGRSNDFLSNLIDIDFEYLSTDLNIQWINLNELRDIEGSINFLIKDFDSKTSLPESTFVDTLKIFNLNSIFENLGNENFINSSNLYISRAQGNFYIGKNRAVFSNPILFETPEAKMKWKGEIIKNQDGLLNILNLDLEMRLKVSENIPWYAALIGGLPAVAGGVVLENIFDDRIDKASTFKFKISGSTSNPSVLRLD